jgi:hypothetical protein
MFRQRDAARLILQIASFGVALLADCNRLFPRKLNNSANTVLAYALRSWVASKLQILSA